MAITNNFFGIGRTVRDPRNLGKECVAFTLALDEGKNKEGESVTQFIEMKAFGRTGEIIEKYAPKGTLIGVEGRLKSGKYEKDGKPVYTQDLIIHRVQLLSGKERSKTPSASENFEKGFSEVSDEDMPF